jgi:hypothetical protein
MKLLDIKPSTKADKKYMATFQSDTGRKKTTHFGQKGADDYIITHNKEQRDRYRTRHAKDLRTHDPTRAGYLSYWLLWGDSVNLQTNIRAYRSRFNL